MHAQNLCLQIKVGFGKYQFAVQITKKQSRRHQREYVKAPVWVLQREVLPLKVFPQQ